MLSIFHWRNFPDCYLEEQGLTAFKINSEYIICAILLLTIYMLYRKREHFSRRVLFLLIGSTTVTIFSELMFTTYVSVYGPSNFIGHILKTIAFLLIYEAVLATGIRKPFELLYRDLEKEKLDLKVEVATRIEMERATDKLNKELARKNFGLEEFARVVSHDLRSPLVAIGGFVRLLRKKLEEGRMEKVPEYISSIEDASGWMEELISQLLKLARAGTALGETEKIRMKTELSAIAKALDSTLNEAGCELVVSNELHDVMGDRTRIRQVFQNIITNAVENRGDQEALRVTIGSALMEEEANTIRFSVTDNGKGLGEADREVIFEMFSRLNPDDRGSGVGLAICKKVVEAHGGEIWAESEGPGKGSSFLFTLPAAN